MTKRSKIALWIASTAIVLGALALFAFFYLPHRKPILLMGAVVVQDSDSRKRVPIADVGVTANSEVNIGSAKSDSSGFFSMQLPATVRRGRPITLSFRHGDYIPFDLNDYVTDKLYVAQMVPLSKNRPSPSTGPSTTVANVRVRYSIKAMTAANIGSAVKTFQIQNTGNIPCKGRDPCSPDGTWKAAIGSASLDAGPGNEFRNVRVSCIAGPCPFTRIENDGFSRGGQKVTASARGWSDTTTFLMEAEVFHPMVSEIVHESHPVIFGRALNFTLPGTAEGVCIQADLAGETIIFPLGPNLFLSWANCGATGNKDQTRGYRCELKPNYQFPESAHEQATP